MRKSRIVIALVTLIALVLAGSAVYADSPVEERAGRAEVRFLEGMIDHHQMALDMAADCLAKASTESVRTLCQNIVAAQSREILTMRGWLLSWYAIDYVPMSMLHSGGQHGAASGGMMGMSGMMGMMSGMMEMMSGMMGQGGMGMGMMGQDSMGMGMMGQDGMGMGTMGQDGMGMGAAAAPMGPMSDMSVMRGLQMLSMMNTMTMGQFLEAAADLDDATPLMQAIEQMLAAGGMDMNMAQMMPMMGSMTHGQMMGMFTEMGNLTMADMREMMGHLDDGPNATMMELMQHHMQVMAAGGQTAGQPAGGDHAAHHSQGGAQTGGGMGNMGGMAGGMAAGGGPAADPVMTMGMFAGLNALTGVEYEIAWLEAMIDHHDDALHMAQRILERAPEGVGHDQLRSLAAQIITDQTSEIELMEALIVELSA